MVQLARRKSATDFTVVRNEVLLRDEPQRYVEMVRNISEFGIHLIDAEGRIRSWNRGARNITGWREAEALALSFVDLFPEDARREGTPARLLEQVRRDGHYRGEQRRQRCDGAGFHALVTLDVVRSPSGEVLAYVEVFSDISERKQREDELYALATRDPLTGASNRSHFTELATQEIERARRFAVPFSLMLLDVDHFKQINDVYGHAAGDEALVALVRRCRRVIRRVDFMGRMGGEEFAIALPQTAPAEAMELANRLRREVEARPFRLCGRRIPLTVSIGIAGLHGQIRDLHELFCQADAALYRSKREGRNRVTLAP